MVEIVTKVQATISYNMAAPAELLLLLRSCGDARGGCQALLVRCAALGAGQMARGGDCAQEALGPCNPPPQEAVVPTQTATNLEP